MEKSKNSSMTTTVVVAIVALVVGGLIAFGTTKAADNMKLADATMPTSTTKAADLRANLVTLGVEHMTLTDQAVDAALDGSPNAAATGKSLYDNGNTIGAAVGSIYGTSAESTFDKVWKLHLDQFVAYAVADSKGDATAKQAALDTINTQYTIPLAQFLAKANPNLPEAALQTSLSEHVAMTAKMIDDHVNGDYATEASDLSAANDHMKMLFSTLAGAIVKQYPSKF